ncbi:MAG: outer membrane lipoprotein chaperone LolA [Porticoccaceae bacterium]|nr:outer membrane lipoprotein chaperone LolA [Porticoccaceae bacterium]
MPLIRNTVINLLLIASLNAQASGTSVDLQQLRDLLQPITSLSAQFEQQVTDANGFPVQNSSGLFQVAQPNNMRWIVSYPMPQQMISDGTTLWLYDPDLDQVIVQPFDAKLQSTPAVLFSGELDELGRAYEINQSTPGVFDLAPVRADSLFQALQISFTDGVPQSIVLTDGLGQTTYINFKEVDVNPVLASGLFKFDIPPNVDVIRND